MSDYIVHKDNTITREGFSEQEITDALKGFSAAEVPIHQLGRKCLKRTSPVLISTHQDYINCTECIQARVEADVL